MAYRIVSMLLSSLGGMLAARLFTEVWKRVSGEDDAPSPDDRDHTWPQILLAATIQGAIFGFVRAVVQRAGAQGVRRTTGRWPGDD